MPEVKEALTVKDVLNAVREGTMTVESAEEALGTLIAKKAKKLAGDPCHAISTPTGAGCVY